MFGKLIPLALFLFFLFLSWMQYLPISFNWNYWGIHDWDQHFLYHAHVAHSIENYFQFPLWNPYSCGGGVSWQNPQTRILTPFLPLHLLFSTPVALKLEIFFHLALALSGVYLVARRLFGIDNIFLIMLAAFPFAFNTFISSQIAVGHTHMFAFCYLPFVFLYFEEALQQTSRARLLLCAFFLSLLFYEAATYILAFTLVFLVAYAVCRDYNGKGHQSLIYLFWLGLFFLVMAAPRLLPLLDYLQEYPRYTSGAEMIHRDLLSTIFFNSQQDLDIFGFPGQTWGWHEYSGVTTHPYQYKADQKAPAVSPPADCILGWPWFVNNLKCGNRPWRTSVIESSPTPFA